MITIKKIIGVLAPIIGGIVVGLIISGYINYQDLAKPPLAPSKIIFPIAWTILYILMGVSYYLFSKDNDTDDFNKIYYLQLFVNLLWPIIFFVFNMYFTAFFWLVLLIILVIIMIKELAHGKKLAAYLQIPYLLWLFYAAYLNFFIAILN